MKRYSAKLLFQFRVKHKGRSNCRRWCEERIICFEEKDSRTAVVHAKAAGREAVFSYHNDDNQPVLFEFVGIVDMIELGPECDADEVWYDLFERVRPMERKQTYVRGDKELLQRVGGATRTRKEI